MLYLPVEYLSSFGFGSLMSLVGFGYVSCNLPVEYLSSFGFGSLSRSSRNGTRSRSMTTYEQCRTQTARCDQDYSIAERSVRGEEGEVKPVDGVPCHLIVAFQCLNICCN